MVRLGRWLGRSEALGLWGERLAARHLKKQRYRLLGRNVRSRVGEVDILALAPDGRTLVVVEVKTRMAPPVRTPRTPRPEDQITNHKRRKLLSLASYEAKRLGMERSPVRIDVIAIEKDAGGAHELRHRVSAVTRA